MLHNAGSLNIDDVFQVTHIVRPGETIPSQTMNRFAGGKGLNQSMALARAGVRVRHIGLIGEDGVFLRDILENNGVNVSGIKISKLPTGHAIIQVAADGENSIILYSGANQNWGRQDVQRIRYDVQSRDILLLQNEINMLPELIRTAHEAGLRIAMNPAPMGPEVKDYPLEHLSWLIVNEIEGRELAGIDIDEQGGNGGEEEVVAELHRRYPGTVIVMTLGKRGAIRMDGIGLIRSFFPDVGPIVDTTGAGDSFIGYLLAGEIFGLSREEGLRRACAAGALSVTRKGAAISMPRWAEVDALIL
ncbi:Ribokinase [Olavius algarvensis spirochete endosymbiont]|uniref:ribokinase n=1 Tax=Olavius algarvensis spirochete endosymbiont TaxID=260710 RepID=UPI000F16CCB3|nr:ribokinase [Olavius algarvensis spirochete endosymbiont]VDB00126.1 Ribokinase [Olavius algarvensis spirochete endosymbiont]